MKIIDKGIAYFRRNGARQTLARCGAKLRALAPAPYGRWLKKHRMGADELRREEQKYAGELASLWVMRGTEAVPDGCRYVLFAPGDGVLEREAPVRYARAIKENPGAQLFYGDSDVLSRRGRALDPLFKPDFDLYLLRGFNYIGESFLVSAQLLDAVKGWREKRSYDLLLCCAEQAGHAVHIPHILYHAAKNGGENEKEQERALAEHLARCQIEAKIGPGEGPGIRRIHYRLPQTEPEPLVSILIPNRDHLELLKPCLDSLRSQKGFAHCEVLLLENGSTDPETQSFYRQSCASDPERIRLLVWKEAFNYSAINNFGAKQARGRYLLFLNNDTQMLPGCLRELLNYASREDVGAVGARMYYEDGTLQHAGVILGYGGLAGHAFEGMKKEQYRKIPWALAAREYSAVTAACMMVPRAVFEQAGGFDETLGVAYNDIDLCLRIRRMGKKVICNPYAQLYHFESRTRGLEMTREKAARVSREADLFRERWAEELRLDPCYNPNLTLERADFSRRR